MGHSRFLLDDCYSNNAESYFIDHQAGQARIMFKHVDAITVWLQEMNRFSAVREMHNTYIICVLTLAGFLLLQALCLKPTLCLAAELSRQPNGLAGWLKSPGTVTRGLTALLEAAQDNWGENSNRRFQWNLSLQLFSHPSSEPLVLIRLTGELEPIPCDRGKGISWTGRLLDQ